MTADRLGQEAFRSLLVTLFCQQEIYRLACLIHGTIEVIPLTFDLDVGLVHAPADPHRALAAMKRFFQLGTVFHDPALDGRVVDRHATLLHAFFARPIAQRVGDVPPYTDQENVLGDMGPLYHLKNSWLKTL